MFELSWGELFLIGVVALLVLGPEEFPRALRTMGQWVKKLKETVSQVQSQVHDAIKDVDVTTEIKTSLDNAKPTELMAPLKEIQFFGDDLAKTWNADILAKTPEMAETPISLDAPTADKPVTKPRVRVKAKRQKQGEKQPDPVGDA